MNHFSENSRPKSNDLVNWLKTSNNRLVVVVFTAPWSGSGAILRNFMGEISREMPELAVEWVDLEDNAQLASSLGVNHIPSIILFRNHEVVDHIDGMLPRRKLVKRMLPFV